MNPELSPANLENWATEQGLSFADPADSPEITT